MSARFSKFMFFSVTFLSIVSFQKDCYALIPLPTFDFKRIAESIKKVTTEIQFWKAEIEDNVNMVKMIQNGGYSEAAGALFGKIESGDYDRYGARWDDSKAALEGGAKSTQAAFMEKDKRRATLDELAKKEEERKRKVNEEAEKAANEQLDANVEKEKQSIWTKAYNWVKAGNGTSVNNAVTGSIGAMQGGGSFGDVVSTMRDNGTNGAINDLIDNNTYDPTAPKDNEGGDSGDSGDSGKEKNK